MYKIILITLFIHITLTGLFAQTDKTNGIDIIPIALEQKGDSLYIQCEFIVDSAKHHSVKNVDLTPFLVGESQNLELPKLSFKNRRYDKAYHRDIALMNKSEKEAYFKKNEFDKLISLHKNEEHKVSYTTIIPFEEWMADAHLDVMIDDCGCDEVNNISNKRVIDKVTLEKEPELEPYLIYIIPEMEKQKQRSVSKEAYLNFKISQSVLYPTYQNNMKELQTIVSMLTSFTDDKYVSIDKISIVGYSSPEGYPPFNEKLSYNRALALKEYVVSLKKLDNNLFTIQSGGEDWDGLVKILQGSTMRYGQTVLGIIADNSTSLVRQKKIRTLDNGGVYKYMLTAYYPKLRKAIVTVNYEVEQFELEKAKLVIKTQPQHLSLGEMFLVANEYKRGSKEFYDVFGTAVHIFPTNEVALLNGAIAAIEKKDVVEAEDYLNKIKKPQHKAEYIYTKAALEMVKGNYKKASALFKEAEKMGARHADKNLKMLDAIPKRFLK